MDIYENVYICSSDVDGALKSALSNAAGMFQPSHSKVLEYLEEKILE